MVDILTKKCLGSDFEPFTNSLCEVYSFEEKKVIQSHKKDKYYSKKRAIVCGDIVEVIQYENGVSYGHNSFASGKKKTVDNKRSDNINASKMALRRLINSNVGHDTKFVTLTYKDNIDDVTLCKNDFKRFIKNLKNNVCKDIKYVYVVEFQKRGSLHFHVVFFNLPYVPSDRLSAWWGKGFIKINKIDNVDNVGAYIVKYMSKDLLDERLNGRDLYGRSRGNLNEPVELTIEQEVDLLEQIYSSKKIYSKTYNSEYHGLVTYEQYNLKRK